MGLGLFIAKTLLERSGAELSFGNGSERPDEARLAGPPEFSRPTGAVVAVVWPRARAGRGRARPARPQRPALTARPPAQRVNAPLRLSV